MTAEKLFDEIGESIAVAIKGNMFGWRCYKVGQKPFLFFDKNSDNAMVFKLPKNEIVWALDLSGSEIFNPGDKVKPMKNWVVIPYRHQKHWKELALKSFRLILKENTGGK